MSRVDGRFMGVATRVNPYEAIQFALDTAAGEVIYCNEQIARLTAFELFERPTTSTAITTVEGRYETVREEPEQLSRWVLIRDAALDRMAKFSRMAAEMGVDERLAALAERQADQVQQFLEHVLDDIELTPKQRLQLGPALRRHADVLEGSAA